MTREKLFEITSQHGLTLQVDRITTGTKSGGFHEYEFAGDRLVECRRAIAAEWGLQRSNMNEFVSVQTVTNPEHPDFNKLYLLVSSFWTGE